jgi:hypothetical protein
MTDNINATDASKAASMLHHTWGLKQLNPKRAS